MSGRTPGDEGRAWVLRYLRGAHVARVMVSAFAVYVAYKTTHEIPVGADLHRGLAIAALIWTSATALLMGPLDRILTRRPWLVWVDLAVLTGLSLVDKPWDAMVTVPLGSFLLMVVYARPRSFAVATAVVVVLQYAPKGILALVGWRHTDLVPPTNTAEWLTAYVVPLFAGVICWVLCVLVHGVESAVSEWDQAQRASDAAQVRQADARARRLLAQRLHDTVSQTVRAIPLRLDGTPNDDLQPEALALRNEILELAHRLRPEVQVLARDLRAARPADR